MFLTPLKTLVTMAMRTTLDADYVNEDFRNIKVGIEFPMQLQDYPGIWVDVEITQELEVAGIGHVEYATGSVDDGGSRSFTRWVVTGYVTYTCVALTSLERDRLFDEIVRIMAFGRESAPTSEFRNFIESNDLLAINFDFDQIGIRAIANASGTPWGTDEMIYEATVAMEFVGEFVGDQQTQTLIPLSAVLVYEYADTEEDPTDPEGWI